MKYKEYIIHTKLTEQEIKGKIKNVNHFQKNLFIKHKMFKNINRKDAGELNFIPNFGTLNIMSIAWKYNLSFDYLEKGYIKIKVENKFNFLILIPLIPMVIFVGLIMFSFSKEVDLGKVSGLLIFFFSFMFISFFAFNYFSIKSYKKKTINLLTTLLEGEIEYIK